MARDGYTQEITEINALMPQILEGLTPPARPGGDIPVQYILVVNGRVPWGERTRTSQAACRSALRRMLRRRLYDLIYYPRRRENREMPWEQWKRYERPALERVIKQMEESGIVEYRASNFDRTNTGLTS